jgi:hypothetical protein
MRFLEREAFDYVPLMGHDTKASEEQTSFSFVLQEPGTQEPVTSIKNT